MLWVFSSSESLSRLPVTRKSKNSFSGWRDRSFFIKEQAADYTKYNETAIAKGLVREAAAVRALESLSLDCDEAALSERAKGLWLTGICLLDAQGELVCEYTEDGIGYAQLQSGIKLEPILSVIGYPQKTYVKHVELDDGSFADVAVHSCADGAGASIPRGLFWWWRRTGYRPPTTPL